MIPEGATNALIEKIYQTIDSWHNSYNGEGWYDIIETNESLVYCNYLDDEQMRDLIGEIKEAIKL